MIMQQNVGRETFSHHWVKIICLKFHELSGIVIFRVVKMKNSANYLRCYFVSDTCTSGRRRAPKLYKQMKSLSLDCAEPPPPIANNMCSTGSSKTTFLRSLSYLCLKLLTTKAHIVLPLYCPYVNGINLLVHLDWSIHIACCNLFMTRIENSAIHWMLWYSYWLWIKRSFPMDPSAGITCHIAWVQHFNSWPIMGTMISNSIYQRLQRQSRLGFYKRIHGWFRR